MRTSGVTLPLSPAGRRWLGFGLAAIGYALLAGTLVGHGIEGDGGSGGIDAIAYWTAARNVVAGAPLYGLESGDFAAYSYPPVLAQVLAPVSFLPMPAFVWLWRALELIGLRVAVGSWKRAGWAMLVFPPILAELDAGNVHLIMAGVCAAAMRGHALAIAPAALLKFASVPLAPIGLRFDRRGLLIGLAVTGGLVGLSYVINQAAWADFLGFLQSTTFPRGWYNLAEAVPLPVRLAAAAVLGLAAIRWVRLAPLAVLLAYPVVWFHALSTLVAVASPVRDAVSAPATSKALEGAPAIREPARLAEPT